MNLKTLSLIGRSIHFKTVVTHRKVSFIIQLVSKFEKKIYCTKSHIVYPRKKYRLGKKKLIALSLYIYFILFYKILTLILVRVHFDDRDFIGFLIWEMLE